jgi:hypothetical protein
MSISVPLYGFGGGISLNFDVKAYATSEILKAATPKNNTIGFVSSTPMPSWEIGEENPYETQSENLYKAAPYAGYINESGEITSSTTAKYTDYIELPERARRADISMGTVSTSSSFHAFYDEDKVLISTFLRKTGKNNYEVPENAKFIRMSVMNSDNPELIVTSVKDVENGSAWVSSDDLGSIRFNALKKNGIIICPSSVSQVEDGKIVEKQSYIYQNGEWVELITWLYNNGKEKYTLKLTEQYPSGVSFVNGDDFITVSINKADVSNRVQGVYVELPEMIDLTPYTTMKCVASKDTLSVGNLLLGVTKGTAEGEDFISAMLASANMKWDTVDTDTVCSLDVSNINEKAYPAVRMYTSGNTGNTVEFKFKEWWLE